MNLGELEKSILQYLWQYQPADAKTVHAYFSDQRSSTLNTIQSALDRLYKKGLLKRDKQGHAFQYQALQSKQEFVGQLMNDVAADFISDEPARLQAAFVSMTQDADDDTLADLEKMIQQRRAQQAK
jgi:predicted transcriptional regulator